MSATAATPPATSAGAGELTHKQILTILSGLMLGMFLASLDQMIVATAIRTIGDDLHGLSVQAWVTTAFLITASAIPATAAPPAPDVIDVSAKVSKLQDQFAGYLVTHGGARPGRT